MHSFSGGEKRTNFLLKGFCTGKIYQADGSFQGVNFLGEILHSAKLLEFLFEIPLCVLLSVYRLHFTRGNGKGRFSE